MAKVGTPASANTCRPSATAAPPIRPAQASDGQVGAEGPILTAQARALEAAVEPPRQLDQLAGPGADPYPHDPRSTAA